MKYGNLSEQQKEWISEIQRYFTIRYMHRIGIRWDPVSIPTHPIIVADTETGEVFETTGEEDEPFGIVRKLGEIPRKAIPFRRSKGNALQIRRVSRYEISGALE